ncbi:MAG: AmmeMemoRadiSam system protein B [Dehalococcoidales bacterium]|nr:AmmeMemoRadiSam system protein B [Dehalococcoidales bacterium]
METRSAVVAGQFYPGTPETLKSTIKEMIDEEADKQKALGIIVPHAGYMYSGRVAGATLSRIEFTDTFIIIGPSHTGLGKPLSVMTEGIWETPLGDVEIDTELATEILDACNKLKEDSRAHNFEHAIEVQLPFLQYFKPDVKIVPIVLGYANVKDYKDIGKGIAAALKKTGREAVIMVSSDMNHYEPQDVTKDKDSLAIEAMIDLDEDELISRVRENNITMCGVAPAMSMITAVKELGASPGELVMYRTSGDTTGDVDSVVGYAGVIIPAMSSLVKLAKDTVDAYITKGEIIEPPETLTSEMENKAGVFVSIHKKGALRGCIGTFEPSEENVAREIIINAISSATRDPRFSSIDPEELDLLDYSVDVLTEPELVEDEDQLDPHQYGVIVESGYHRGLLLPDLEGVDTVEQQIDICRQKAGIPAGQPVQLYRFEVRRYK